MLDIYYAEFGATLKEVEGLISAYPTISQDSKQEYAKNVDKRIEDLKECLNSLSFEIRSCAPSQRAEVNAELSSLKQKYEECKKRWLFSSSKTICANSAEKLEKLFEDPNEKLDLSRRIMEETERIGEDVLINLSGQRTTIERTKANTAKVSDNLKVSSKVTAKMSTWVRRMF